MRREETQIQWHSNRDLVNLAAHWLVDTGEITTVHGLLAYYEHPEEHDAAFKAAMADMADGRQRGPLPGVEPEEVVLEEPPFRVGVRLPPVLAQPCLFEVEEVAA